jgi:hypothetical protein
MSAASRSTHRAQTLRGLPRLAAWPFSSLRTPTAVCEWPELKYEYASAQGSPVLGTLCSGMLLIFCRPRASKGDPSPRAIASSAERLRNTTHTLRCGKRQKAA